MGMSIKSDVVHEDVFGEVYTQKEFMREYGLDDGVSEDEYQGAQIFDGEKLVSPEEYEASQKNDKDNGEAA